MVPTIKNCSVEIDVADDTDLDGQSVKAIKEEFLHSNLEKQIQEFQIIIQLSTNNHSATIL